MNVNSLLSVSTGDDFDIYIGEIKDGHGSSIEIYNIENIDIVNNFFAANKIEILDNHIIDGVPYTPQSEGYYCYYASITMILKYLGFNTSIDEILFYDGLGYTHNYNQEERLPNNRIYTGISFVFDLFGVEGKRWFQNYNISDDNLWALYYSKLTQNISNNKPVITSIDPFSLPSLRNQLKISNYLWNFLFPPGMHVIVVVGYNNINQSVCFHDPNAGFYGDNSFGDYAWMSIDNFKSAVEKAKSGRYFISTIEKDNDSYTKKERFEKTFNMSIEGLKGGFFDFPGIYGINASRQLRIDFSIGENNQDVTIDLYKAQGGNGLKYSIIEILYMLLNSLNPDNPNIFSILKIGNRNPYEDIAVGKNHVADYLETCPFYTDLCINQSKLLRLEAKNWNELSKLYDIFLRRGIFLSTYRGILVIKYMEKLVKKIIDIEETIINETSQLFLTYI